MMNNGKYTLFIPIHPVIIPNMSLNIKWQKQKQTKQKQQIKPIPHDVEKLNQVWN